MFYISREDEKSTELANCLAVISKIADQKTAIKICEKLVDQSLIETSLSMKSFKYDALIQCEKEKYKDAVLGEIRKNYKMMLDIDSTTVWEVIQGPSAFGDAGSLCHGWSATPVYYYQILSKK